MRARSLLGLAAAAAVGAALGYEAERRWVGPIQGGPVPFPVPGELVGERHELAGPGGSTIDVECFGPPDAPTIVLSHGWTNTGRIWHEQVIRLADRFRLVTYDHPGHGRSDAPDEDYSLDLFGDALGTVLETVPGPVVLAGHSLGGMSILNLARRRPDLVHDRVGEVLLCSTTSRARADDVAFGLGIHTWARIELGLRHALNIGGTHASRLTRALYRTSSDVSHLVVRHLALNADAATWHVDLTEEMFLHSDVDMIFAMASPVLTLNEDDGLERLRIPTTVVVGAKDQLTAPALSKRMARRRPEARVHVLPGVGHMLPLEAGAVVAVLLEAAATRLAPNP